MCEYVVDRLGGGGERERKQPEQYEERCNCKWPALLPGVKSMSQPELPLRVVSGSVAMQW